MKYSMETSIKYSGFYFVIAIVKDDSRAGHLQSKQFKGRILARTYED